MPMSSHEYQFGQYQLAPAARELWHDGELVAIPPKSFDCLVYLVEHRDRAVGRDELISAVWGRASVSDDVLAQTLLRARRAVGDTGNEQKAIRTVPRFGYRWVLPIDDSAGERTAAADVVATVSETPVAPPAAVGGVRARKRGFGIAAWGLAGLALLVAAVFVVRSLHRGATPDAMTTDDHVVLVLPVEVTGGDRESSWIRLGAMDYLASGLREHTRLTILPSEQTLLLAGARVDPSDAATLRRLQRATGAGYILAPHATASGDAWSFVVDAYHADGVHSYEARAQGPLDAADLAAVRFASGLGVPYSRRASASAATELAQRMDAATLAGDLVEAHRLVDGTPEALRSDPLVRIRIAQIAFRAGQLDAARAQFDALATDATLAPGSRAQVQMGLGAIAVRGGDFDAADGAYSQAIATLGDGHDDPNLLGSAWSGRGVANGARGRSTEALADFERARAELERAGNRIDIASLDVNGALVMSRIGRYADAASAFDRAIDAFARFDVRDDLAAALAGKLNLQATSLDGNGALATARRLMSLEPELENPILKRHVFFGIVQALIVHGELALAARRIGNLDAGERDAAGVDLLRARLALERGDATAADAAVAKAIASGLDQPMPLAASEAVGIATLALRRGGDPVIVQHSLDALGSALETRKDVDAPRAIALARAELAVASGDATTAADRFRAALAEADKHGAPDAIVATLVAELAWDVRTKRMTPGAEAAARLQPWSARDYDAARVLAAWYRVAGDAERLRVAEADLARLAGERDPSTPL